ncbi:3-hydroxybutyryl-CoA dehydrogenase [Candidatus Formimonas warabiya]|uniref:L-gulonate 3-dehydrogenase n=1 Tax=Formimonas warabiya TaxID=1761012 RepID=A0A3G1KNM8_FORW1|nr:3-hydroxybutyryl-CoA dehydrogenase [Candidatus Formimonas warabiya]ATW24069.1 3-hydroxybutyryl-CoA dehydrogenase [Candidatus Formimonas warabiya]
MEKPKIAIVGCGRMGIGIAQVFAYEGFMVNLIDAKERSGEEANEVFRQAGDQIAHHLFFLSNLNILDKKMIAPILQRINFYPSIQMDSALLEADLVFEAVPEVGEIKKTILDQLNRWTKEETIIASTTSTFSVNDLAGQVLHPERFLCTHWLNPAYLMPLVEVSPGEHTSRNTLDQIFRLLESIGKIPVKCNPSPGFIVPRIQALAMNEAARLAEEGVASPEDIDKASRFGFGLRFAVLGLLEFIDWGGGDILYYASNYLKDSFQEDRFSPPQVVVEHMEQGHIGIKSGKGFFDYSQRDMARYQQETIAKFVDLLNHLGLIRPPHQEA